MSSKDPVKITLPDDEDGEPQGWILFRGRGDKFKAGERQALYAYVDEMKKAGVGDVVSNIRLVRRMSCHLIRDWSFDLPRPIAHVINGQVTGYENEGSLDQLDTVVEDEILLQGGQWLKQVTIGFQPSRDPESPYRALRRLKSALEGQRRIEGRSYPDQEYLYHRLAKEYGWTPQQVDAQDAELIDWLVAIMGVEAEIVQEHQKKQEAQMKRQQARRPRRL